MSLINRRQKKEQKELQHRADQFMAEYKVIRARYRCDFQAYLEFKDQGQGGIAPSLRIIDITKTIAMEEEAERKKEEAIEKQKNEGSIKPVEPSKDPGTSIKNGFDAGEEPKKNGQNNLEK